MSTGTDGVVPLDRVGRVLLPGLGPLDVWWLGSYGGGLFLPVRHPAATSYGGGRYVLGHRQGCRPGRWSRHAGGRPQLRLPALVHDTAWACPLPGPGNTLGVPVPVGERHRG